MEITLAFGVVVAAYAVHLRVVVDVNILFITDNFPPEVNAPATRTFEHCKQWIQHGAKVTVITCAPNFPQGRVYDGYRNKLYQREVVDGIDVVRVWSYIAPNEGFAKRILDYLSFAFMALFFGLNKPCDVIIATSPQFFTTLSGCALSWLKRRPWVFELRDLWPESIVAVGAMRRGKMVIALEKLEMFLYRRADLIVAVTEAFRKNLENRGIDKAKIEVIPNGANPSEFSIRPRDQALIEALDVEGKFVISYIGTHGLAHGLDFVVNAASSLRRDDIVFLFVGDGATKSDVVELTEELKLDNVRFVDPVPKEKVPAYLSISSAALVNLRKTDTFKTVIPSKIFEAAAMQVPILLGVAGQAKEIVEEFEAGLCYEPENSADFASCICRLVDDREGYQSLQSGCKRLAQAYDRSLLASKMYDLLNRL